MQNEHAMKLYYRDIFPLSELFKILEINETREISMYTQQNTYLRYLTFDSIESFKAKIIQITPKKMDIGPFYDIKPSKTNGATAIAKELVFDIDLTDYPRECCQDKSICKKCYEIIKCSVKLLNYILKEEFGFKNIGFVFSGRRGLHCWVFDWNELDNSVRTDIFKYFRYILDRNLEVKEYMDIMSEYGEEDLIKKLFLRLDKEVTVKMNHLIKLPFSVHPETMNISVPLDPENITELEEIPRLDQIIEDPEVILPYIEIMKGWRSNIQI